MDIETLLEQRKQVLQDKILINGCMVMTDKAKKELTRIDLEIGRLKSEMDNKEIVSEIEDRIAHVFDEVITDIDGRLEDKIVKRLDVIEQYLKGIVGILEVLVENK